MIKRRHHRETGERDALETQSGGIERAGQAIDSVDAGGSHEDALQLVATFTGYAADPPVVDHELVEADRQEVVGEMTDGAIEIWPVERGGQLYEPHHQPWVRKPDAHLARQVVLTEELAQLPCEPVVVDDLAIDHEADRQWMDDCLAHATAV